MKGLKLSTFYKIEDGDMGVRCVDVLVRVVRGRMGEYECMCKREG